MNKINQILRNKNNFYMILIYKMTTMEKQLECFYLDGSKQNASDMLRECVQDQTSSFEFNCKEDALKQELSTDIKDTTRINDISIQR